MFYAMSCAYVRLMVFIISEKIVKSRGSDWRKNGRFNAPLSWPQWSLFYFLPFFFSLPSCTCSSVFWRDADFSLWLTGSGLVSEQLKVCSTRLVMSWAEETTLSVTPDSATSFFSHVSFIYEHPSSELYPEQEANHSCCLAPFLLQILVGLVSELLSCSISTKDEVFQFKLVLCWRRKMKKKHSETRFEHFFLSHWSNAAVLMWHI